MSDNFSVILDAFLDDAEMTNDDIKAQVKRLLRVLSFCSLHKESVPLLGSDKRFWLIIDEFVTRGPALDEVEQLKCCDQVGFFVF